MIPTYQSRIIAPTGANAGQEAVALQAADKDIKLQNLLIMGTKIASAGATTNATTVVSATGTSFSIENVAITAAQGVAANVASNGAVGTDGTTGGKASGSGTAGSGASSTCNSNGGTGGKTDSITAKSHLT
ncbi:MAG: hypothetical protein L3J52_02210, partial [Proteobacteria bacterium]|nr:hypothetical protein [Pseudomonadota bacterium]